jgi:DNA topoisomerase-1
LGQLKKGEKLSDLVIVESPTKAKTLTKILGGTKVLSTKGHIMELSKDYPTKEQRGEGWPINGVDQDFNPDWKPVYGSVKIINEIKKEAKKADQIYLASDPDREGEGISYHVLQILLESGIPEEKIKRSTFHEVTETAVKKSMEDADKVNMPMVDAFIARRVLDRLVGFIVSKKLNSFLRLAPLSAGRVQSPTLGLVTDREDEINAFIPEEFWNINAAFSLNSKKYDAQLFKLPGISEKDFKINNETEAKDIEEKIKTEKFSIESIKVTNRSSKPSAPYTTSSLQQDASTRLSMSPTNTMRNAQELFEGIDEQEGLITYMRTDSPTLSNQAMKDIEKQIINSYGDKYFEKRTYTAKVANAQEAHEAIRPTSISRTPESMQNSLNEYQYKLYQLIWNRTVASQMTNSLTEKTTLITSSSNGEDGHKFKSEADKLVFDGFKKLIKSNEKYDELPDLTENQAVDLEEIEKEQKFTRGPGRYSQASLIKKMEEIGIGRPSTYASTISLITNRTYVFNINRAVWGSPLGYAVSGSLSYFFHDNFMNYDFTKKMEDDLDKISNGGLDRQKFTKDFYESLLNPVESMVKKSNEDDWNPYDTDTLSTFLDLSSSSSSRGMHPYNLIPTTILCSKKNPAINIRTGQDFTENDLPISVATSDEIRRETDKNNGDHLMRAVRRKKDGKYFLACPNQDPERCPISYDIDAWAGRGRRRERALAKLKEEMAKPNHNCCP